MAMAKTTISLDWISKYGDVSSKHFGKMRIQWEYHGTLLHIIASSPMVLDGFNLKFLAWWQHLWRIKRMGKHQGDCTSTQIQIVPVAPGLTVLDTTIQVWRHVDRQLYVTLCRRVTGHRVLKYKKDAMTPELLAGSPNSCTLAVLWIQRGARSRGFNLVDPTVVEKHFMGFP